MGSRLVDSAITYRIIKKLITPFHKTEAFALGLIDETGHIIRKPNTDNERDALTLLDRLCFRLKRIISSNPYQARQLSNLSAAMALVREHLDNGDEAMYLEREFIDSIQNYTPDYHLEEQIQQIIEGKKMLTFGLYNENDGGLGAGIPNAEGGGFSGQATANPNPNLAGRDIIMGKIRRRSMPQIRTGMKPLSYKRHLKPFFTNSNHGDYV